MPALPTILTRVVAIASVVSAAVACAGPIDVELIDRVIAGQPVRGMVATVDLSDPCVDVVVTGPMADARAPVEAELIPTDEWARSVSADLAINANYFATIGMSEADVIGLSVSDGVLVSPARDWNDEHDPAIVFLDGRAAVGRFGFGALSGASEAVAGVGGSRTSPVAGGLLVTDGVNTGASARVQPNQRHPRTAVGVDASGETVVITVIDGRREEWSAGLTLPQLADLMIEFGADDAVNLDGGGSSSFVFRNDAGELITNRPSDGRFRAVANHLGFRCVTAGERNDAEPSNQTGPSRDSGSGPR